MASNLTRNAATAPARPYFGVYYASEGQEPQLCEVDGGVCFEAHRTEAGAQKSVEQTEAIYRGNYIVLPIPAGTLVCDRETETKVIAGAHVAAPAQTSAPLILTTAQAQAVYSAMCALNNVGGTAGTVTIPNGEHRDQTGSPSVTWHFAGVIVSTKYVGSSEHYDSQAAFAAAYGLPVAAPDLVAALRAAYSDIQRLPGHTIDMLSRIEAAIEQAVA